MWDMMGNWAWMEVGGLGSSALAIQTSLAGWTDVTSLCIHLGRPVVITGQDGSLSTQSLVQHIQGYMTPADLENAALTDVSASTSAHP